MPNWSRAVTWTAGVTRAPATTLDGCPVKASVLAVAAVTLKVALVAPARPAEAAVKV